MNAYESYTITDLYWKDINDSRYLKEYIKVFGAIRSEIYYIDTERVFEEFVDMVNKGSKKIQNYVDSDQVVIILPSFKRESKDLLFVDDKGVSIFKERTISVGDEISYNIDGTSYKKKIGGIIYQLKDSISYPFKQPFTIIEYKKTR